MVTTYCEFKYSLGRTVELGFAFLSADYQLLPPATGHDIVSDVQHLISFLGSKNLTFPASTTEAQKVNCKINTNALVLAGSSAGGLCAYLGASAHPRPKALISLYGMGGDLLVRRSMQKYSMFSYYLYRRPTGWNRNGTFSSLVEKSWIQENLKISFTPCTCQL